MKTARLCLFSAAFLALVPGAGAHAADSIAEGARLCTQHLPKYERSYGIPVHLLSAIATTESGRWSKSLKLSVPWPWTINAEGKGYYFDTKQEAIAAAKQLRARGVSSMDVGCMQVNLRHHPNAFSSIEQAFEPERNVAYAASFLRGLFNEQGSWRSAAAAYHSRTPSYGMAYVGHVFNRWQTLVNRTRGGAMPENQVASAPAAPYGARTVATSAKAAPVKPLTYASSARASSMPSVRYIEVKNQRAAAPRPRSAETLAVRAPSRVVMTPAVATASASAPAPSAHMIRVSNPPTVSYAAGPRFIFSD